MAPANIGRWEALLEEGVEVGLVCAREWPEGGIDIKAADVKTGVQLFPMKAVPKGKGPYYVYLPGFGPVVKRFRPDLIHFREEVFTVCGGEFLIQRRMHFRSAPFVFESHQNIRKKYPWPASWFESIAYRNAAGAVAGIPSVESVLRQGGFRGPVEMIPLGGVTQELFHPNGPKIQELTRADVPLVGYMGRLAPEKGVDDLIRALAGTNARLVLIGDGSERQALVDLAIQQKVDAIFVGPVTQESAPGYLRSLDVLVLPSRTTPRWKEQWGRVLTEAMACGTPVIGSDSGEIPWVIGDAGLVYPEGSVRAMNETIRKVLEDKDLAWRLRNAGLKRAAEFTWDRHAEKTARFYQRLLR